MIHKKKNNKTLMIGADEKANSTNSLGRAALLSKGDNIPVAQFLVIKHQHFLVQVREQY